MASLGHAAGTSGTGTWNAAIQNWEPGGGLPYVA